MGVDAIVCNTIRGVILKNLCVIERMYEIYGEKLRYKSINSLTHADHEHLRGKSSQNMSTKRMTCF